MGVWACSCLCMLCVSYVWALSTPWPCATSLGQHREELYPPPSPSTSPSQTNKHAPKKTGAVLVQVAGLPGQRKIKGKMRQAGGRARTQASLSLLCLATSHNHLNPTIHQPHTMTPPQLLRTPPPSPSHSPPFSLSPPLSFPLFLSLWEPNSFRLKSNNVK